MAYDKVIDEWFENRFSGIRTYLYRTARNMIDDPDDAMDLVQDTRLAAYEKLGENWHDFQSSEAFDKWVYKILVNKGLNILKHRKRAKTYNGLKHELYGEISPTSDDRIAQRLMLQACIMNLSDSHRDAIILFYYKGHSYQELTEILDTTEASVKMRLFRGRQAIKEMMDETDYA